MNLPDTAKLHRVVNATWPAAQTIRVGPWDIRDGQDGGSRVSAATAHDAVGAFDLPQAETVMRTLGQTPLFMIRQGDEFLDNLLEKAGYAIKDPVIMYAAPVATLTNKRPPPVTVFTVWPPLAAQAEIWAEGGIGPARLAVMDRAPHPKTTLFGRINDRPAGTVYLGCNEGCAMIHALEVAIAHRGQGLAAHLTHAGAHWAHDQGMEWLTLLTTEANVAANTLYSSLGMAVVGHYHYRSLSE